MFRLFQFDLNITFRFIEKELIHLIANVINTQKTAALTIFWVDFPDESDKSGVAFEAIINGNPSMAS